jgi:hypothetical protein
MAAVAVGPAHERSGAAPWTRAHGIPRCHPAGKAGNSGREDAAQEAGQVPSEPHRATPSDIREVTGDQRAAGFKSGRLAW